MTEGLKLKCFKCAVVSGRLCLAAICVVSLKRVYI